MTAPKPKMPCIRCGGDKGTGNKYCKPCFYQIRKERPAYTKPCRTCGGPKESGTRIYCVACAHKRMPTVALAEKERHTYKSKAERAARVGVPRKPPKVNAAGDVWCVSHGEYLESFKFAPRNCKSGKFNSMCRPCYSNYMHEQRLLVVYKVTLEQYYLMLAQQDGKCAICLLKPRTQRLAVDHDHKTGAIRGLLCMLCNHKLLGAAREDPDILRRALRYLENPPADSALLAEDGAA